MYATALTSTGTSRGDIIVWGSSYELGMGNSSSKQTSDHSYQYPKEQQEDHRYLNPTLLAALASKAAAADKQLQEEEEEEEEEAFFSTSSSSNNNNKTETRSNTLEMSSILASTPACTMDAEADAAFEEETKNDKKMVYFEHQRHQDDGSSVEFDDDDDDDDDDDVDVDDDDTSDDETITEYGGDQEEEGKQRKQERTLPPPRAPQSVLKQQRHQPEQQQQDLPRREQQEQQTSIRRVSDVLYERKRGIVKSESRSENDEDKDQDDIVVVANVKAAGGGSASSTTTTATAATGLRRVSEIDKTKDAKNDADRKIPAYAASPAASSPASSKETVARTPSSESPSWNGDCESSNGDDSGGERRPLKKRKGRDGKNDLDLLVAASSMLFSPAVAQRQSADAGNATTATTTGGRGGTNEDEGGTEKERADGGAFRRSTAARRSTVSAASIAAAQVVCLEDDSDDDDSDDDRVDAKQAAHPSQGMLPHKRRTSASPSHSPSPIRRGSANENAAAAAAAAVAPLRSSTTTPPLKKRKSYTQEEGRGGSSRDNPGETNATATETTATSTTNGNHKFLHDAAYLAALADAYEKSKEASLNDRCRKQGDEDRKAIPEQQQQSKDAILRRRSDSEILNRRFQNPLGQVSRLKDPPPPAAPQLQQRVRTDDLLPTSHLRSSLTRMGMVTASDMAALYIAEKSAALAAVARLNDSSRISYYKQHQEIQREFMRQRLMRKFGVGSADNAVTTAQVDDTKRSEESQSPKGGGEWKVQQEVPRQQQVTSRESLKKRKTTGVIERRNPLIQEKIKKLVEPPDDKNAKGEQTGNENSRAQYTDIQPRRKSAPPQVGPVRETSKYPPKKSSDKMQITPTALERDTVRVHFGVPRSEYSHKKALALQPGDVVVVPDMFGADDDMKGYDALMRLQNDMLEQELFINSLLPEAPWVRPKPGGNTKTSSCTATTTKMLTLDQSVVLASIRKRLSKYFHVDNQTVEIGATYFHNYTSNSRDDYTTGWERLTKKACTCDCPFRLKKEVNADFIDVTIVATFGVAQELSLFQQAQGQNGEDAKDSTIGSSNKVSFTQENNSVMCFVGPDITVDDWMRRPAAQDSETAGEKTVTLLIFGKIKKEKDTEEAVASKCPREAKPAPKEPVAAMEASKQPMPAPEEATAVTAARKPEPAHEESFVKKDMRKPMLAHDDDDRVAVVERPPKIQKTYSEQLPVRSELTRQQAPLLVTRPINTQTCPNLTTQILPSYTSQTIPSITRSLPLITGSIRIRNEGNNR